MSLVDYASSDEEDEPAGIVEEARNKVNLAIPPRKPPPEKTPLTNQSSNVISVPSRLPDASVLLNSPSMPSNTSGIYDHTSAVAAAMAQNVSRKRDFTESTASYSHGKVPRGNFPHSKNVKNTESGLLCPPQLSGRSNVVTEDISKLFTRRNGSEPSSNKTSSEC